MALGTFIWKIASRCNLNCTYCYVYNAGDSSWRNQPALMSLEVARQVAYRIREHCERHNLHRIIINFHGGEPLLGGQRHLRSLSKVLRQAFAGSDLDFSTAVQTNGMIFTPSIGKTLLENDIGLFVSVDGPPTVNDTYRIDHGGGPTGVILESQLKLITSDTYRPIFSGFLCVVNPASQPEEVLDYLLSFEPPMIDFLLPLTNHDRFALDERTGAYGSWLIACFDRWFGLATKTRVRTFDSIIMKLFRGSAALLADNADAIVIATDGSIEADDTLKTAYQGASSLGYDVFHHDFDQVASDPKFQAVASGSIVAEECQRCPLLEVCGGGHISHRYSKAKGFNNPSVYCADLTALILHIRERLLDELPSSPSLSTSSQSEMAAQS